MSRATVRLEVQVDASRRAYDSRMVTKCTSLPSYWVAVVERILFVGVANLYAYRILQTILGGTFEPKKHSASWRLLHHDEALASSNQVDTSTLLKCHLLCYSPLRKWYPHVLLVIVLSMFHAFSHVTFAPRMSADRSFFRINNLMYALLVLGLASYFALYRCSTVLKLPECCSPHSSYITFQNESYRVLGKKHLICLTLLPHLYVIAHLLARLFEVPAKAHLLTLR